MNDLDDNLIQNVMGEAIMQRLGAIYEVVQKLLPLREDVRILKEDVQDLKVDMSIVKAVVMHHSDKIVDHDRRITKLEVTA